MILQALNTYYQRLLERGTEGISPPSYTQEKIPYVLILSLDGHPLDVQENFDQVGKKSVARLLSVPASFKRPGTTPRAFFLWDKTSYVFGVEKSGKDNVLFNPRSHSAFRELHRKALESETDVGIRAFLKFLENWKPENFKPPLFTTEMLDANFAFRIDGQTAYLHNSIAAQRLWSIQAAGEDSAQGMCLVTGEVRPSARLHPAIKGLPGQTMGGSIVSFNSDAYMSYLGSLTKATSEKKENNSGANAPVSEQAAFAYTTVLNHLLRRSEHNRQRIQIGDTTVVFWAEAADPQEAEQAEWAFASMFNTTPDDEQEANFVRLALEQLAKGRPLSDINPKLQEGTRMFVLGLAPNASRISIRFWQEGTLGQLAQRIAQHEQDMRIEPKPWKTAPAARRLVLATVPNREGAMPKMDDAFNNLVGEFMRAILSGNMYPRSLLANTIMRIRSDGNLSGLRAALCKGILARERRLGINTQNEEVPVSLDKQSTSPGYRLGRLFAVLEAAQRSALGGQVNATIRDRYYGAASATPASVFPVLLRNTQNHLGKLRKEKPGIAVNLERDIRDIVDGLSDHFPRSLRIEDQGRFAIGYYHQSQSRFTKGDTAGTADSSGDSHTDSDSSTDNTTEGAPA